MVIFGRRAEPIFRIQAVVVIRADISGGAVARAVYGRGREVEEAGRSRIPAPHRAVSRVIIGFDNVIITAAPSPRAIYDAVEEYRI